MQKFSALLVLMLVASSSAFSFSGLFAKSEENPSVEVAEEEQPVDEVEEVAEEEAEEEEEEDLEEEEEEDDAEEDFEATAEEDDDSNLASFEKCIEDCNDDDECEDSCEIDDYY